MILERELDAMLFDYRQREFDRRECLTAPLSPGLGSSESLIAAATKRGGAQHRRAGCLSIDQGTFECGGVAIARQRYHALDEHPQFFGAGTQLREIAVQVHLHARATERVGALQECEGGGACAAGRVGSGEGGRCDSQFAGWSRRLCEGGRRKGSGEAEEAASGHRF